MHLFNIILINRMSSIIDNQVFIQDKLGACSNRLVSSTEMIANKSLLKIFKNQDSLVRPNTGSRKCFSINYEGLFYIILLHQPANNNSYFSFQCFQTNRYAYFSLSSYPKEIQFMKSIFNYQNLYKSQPVYYLNQRRISLRLKLTFPEIDQNQNRYSTYFNSIIYNSIKSFHSLLLKIRETDQSCLLKQYRNRQFADEVSIITMISRTNAYFSRCEQNNENQKSLSFIKTHKIQLKKLKESVCLEHQLEKSINSIFISSEKTTQSSWVCDNIVHEGEMLQRKSKKLLNIQSNIQDSSDLMNYNQVELEIKERLSKPIAQGGSSYIFAVKTIISSVDGKAVKKKLQRMMAIKTLKPGADVSLHGKIVREKIIISKLKGLQTTFIPVYFNAANLPGEFRHSILMEYLSGQQLDEFLRVRRISASLKSKVYLLLNILYGLLQLGERDIVHMDLKPINIMVCRGLVSKIIDFGQAFHRDCMKDYRPGFTFPYVAPESYLNLHSTRDRTKYLEFTPKQDVYAFGMIMYEVIFGTRMMQISPEKYRNIYVQREIKDRAFQVPQRFEDLGDWFIFSSFRFIIDKCTDENVDLRPNFNWIAIFLKNILNQSKKL